MKVRCIGDSNTYGHDPRSYWGSRYSPEYRWVDILAKKSGWTIINDGMNGREISEKQGCSYFSEDLLIIMLGTNDLLNGKSAIDTAKNMEHFLHNVDSHKAKVILIAPPRLKLGDWVDRYDLMQESMLLAQYYRELAARNNIWFADSEDWNIPIAFDGVHFNEQGHIFFADRIFLYLQTIIGDSGIDVNND